MEQSTSTPWRRIFSSMATAQDVIPKGEMRSVLLKSLDLKLCVVHTPNGWYVVEDKCPHVHVPLSKGWINAEEEIICPWHNYRWSLRTGQEVTRNFCPDLRSFEVKTGEEGLWVKVA